ncbi:hypothetical protein BAUCODRAFT_37088 [Baudoinia panamericana UAMH 10762]|uniref:ATP synthase F(0) complex subunit e, mitochondrial n=1 Tax=Baudoinia panamericana (strain UAMH 10762) TaxID=717646 RepID=M2MPN0_BAUPA|nr:uncharacterized protein BAUCODRAFT_37088 [Baudoinia panamericana UAMH 10762]EMC93403.1 hypothetical protein BAUCODRAFT_37088 [Baudoinia panamericana UAMH 10762]
MLRWSALFGGILYGFSHQSAITAREKAAAAQHEYERKQKLIEEAKTEYAKKKNPQQFSQKSGGGAFLPHPFIAVEGRKGRDLPGHIATTGVGKAEGSSRRYGIRSDARADWFV